MLGGLEAVNGLGLSNAGVQRWRRGKLELAGDNGGRKGKPVLACVQALGVLFIGPEASR